MKRTLHWRKSAGGSTPFTSAACELLPRFLHFFGLAVVKPFLGIRIMQSSSRGHNTVFVFIGLSAVCILLSGMAGLTRGENTRVLPAGSRPNDARLQPLKDLDGYFPLEVPDSVEAWTRRAEQLRRQLRVACGLWPMPTKMPNNVVVHGQVDRAEYVVQKVYLESFPGHYVTGNLYLPKGKTGRLPAVICPHGHWPSGRFHDHGATGVRTEIAQGAERFEVSGRYPLQARCVQLARMGCIVFHYDMVGYADSQQIPIGIVHSLFESRPAELDTPDGWGLFTTQAELRLQNVMGLQTYNSIRVLDWISMRPDVDPKRIGVTGASGGGTQTFILCAIDSRPAVAFPAVMVSTAMQGGCTCENAICLRVGTGNIEIAGLFAPRPLGLSGADDWTREIMTKGMPELKQLYTLLGVEDNVLVKAFVHFGHNYNAVSRSVMYGFMNQHLKLGFEELVIEDDFIPLSREEMTVWNDENPRPPSGVEYEKSLTRWIHEDSERQLSLLEPADERSLAKYQKVIGGALDVLVGRRLPESGDLEREKIDKQDRGDYFVFKDLLRYRPAAEELPAIFLHPKQWNGEVVIWIDGRGKAPLLDSTGDPRPEIQRLIDAGCSVASADLLFQGEFLEDGEVLTETRKVENPRPFACFTHGYNHSLFARRVHDILTLISFVRNDEHQPKVISLVGVAGAGPLVAAARAQAGDAVNRTVLDTGRFRFVDLKSYRHFDFLPGAVKYGDLPGILSMCAPSTLRIMGEDGSVPAIVQAAYRASGHAAAVTAQPASDRTSSAEAAVGWLLSAEK